MTTNQPHKIASLAYSGANSVDITGPLQVFDTANRLLQIAHGEDKHFYTTDVIGTSPAPIAASAGINLIPAYDLSNTPSDLDTLFIAGGTGAKTASKQQELQQWLQRKARQVRRLASVCTGAFILAEAGLLDKRRATTHWHYVADFIECYPKVKMDCDAIFTQDQSIYCSAGVTAGIDLALALVEEDHGQDLALDVARQLVVFLKRPGGQSQFSKLLNPPSRSTSPIADVQRWSLEHLEEDLSVKTLAQQANMSPRHFARLFVKETGLTPGKFILSARLDKARTLLETSRIPLKTIAELSGIGNRETLRRLFLQYFKTSPGHYRERFLSTGKEA